MPATKSKEYYLLFNNSATVYCKFLFSCIFSYIFQHTHTHTHTHTQPHTISDILVEILSHFLLKKRKTSKAEQESGEGERVQVAAALWVNTCRQQSTHRQTSLTKLYTSYTTLHFFHSACIFLFISCPIFHLCCLCLLSHIIILLSLVLLKVFLKLEAVNLYLIKQTATLRFLYVCLLCYLVFSLSD